MPGTTVGKQLNYGYPGTVSRSVDAIITNRLSDGVIAFGDPVVLSSDNTVKVFGATSTADDLAGIAVREVKQAIDYNTSVSGYLDKERADIITRGAVCIKVNHGTSTANGKVYIRTTDNPSIPEGIVGGFEALADGTNTVEIKNIRFRTGKVDANGVAEVTILERNM